MLSITSKLGCRSWSLQAFDTCPGARASDGTVAEVCEGCYARGGNYRFPAVKAVRERNRDDWQASDWTDRMVEAIGSDPYFRWFDSGDAYALPLLRKIAEVIRRTPNTRHWLPTRMHKFPKFRPMLRVIAAMPNAVVRVSHDDVKRTGWTVQRDPLAAGILQSAVIADPTVPTNAAVCGAYERDGKCGECRVCWAKAVPAVAYPAHGRKMIKLVRVA